MGQIINNLTDYNPPEAESSWLRLEEGTTVIRILSHVYHFQNHYLPDQKKSVDCTGNIATCQWCQKGNKPRSRWAYYVLNRNTGDVKVFEMGWQIFGSILALAKDKDYGDPRNYDLKITRKGTGRDTEYTVIPGKAAKLTEDEEKTLAALGVETAEKATSELLKFYQKDSDELAEEVDEALS